MDLPGSPGEWLSSLTVPWRARREALRDQFLGPPHRTDPGHILVAAACADWLRAAQDHSTSHDGGVARHFSLLHGWSDSYPETTGYLVPTMLDWARISGTEDFRNRARRMLDWLVSIQFPNGAFPGGTIAQTPRVPVAFNTGQILLGLAAGTREWPEFAGSLRRAADWLCETQSSDGAWRRSPSPFARRDDKAYETHVAWGLFEAARITSDQRYGERGAANLRWALTLQAQNGWFSSCCLDDPAHPLTHTIGYALRGIIEGYRFLADPVLLDAAVRCADGLLTAIGPTGAVPGRLDREWRGDATWSCLTGNAQIALCWLLLHDIIGKPAYKRAADAALTFIRRTVRLDGPPSIRGGVKGAFPVNGGYCWWEYPNWAAKFLLDALMMDGGPALNPRSSRPQAVLQP